MSSGVLQGIDELLNEKWGEFFSFDRKYAKEKGVVILCWAATNAPLPLNIEISDVALEKGFINWRELHRKIKLCLPDNIVKQCISEINAVMRDANRRDLKSVEKDFENWSQKTAELVQNVFGGNARETFLAPFELPSNIRPNSIQALHALVETRIERLRQF